MPEIRLSLSFNPLLAVAAALAAGALATIAYRSTVPPVPRFYRILLGCLRGSGLFLLFLLLGEPLFTFLSRSVVPPGILVLIDNSRSMALVDGEQPRSDVVRSFLASAEMKDLSSVGVVSYALFDGAVRPMTRLEIDSLRFSGARTNIEAALSWVRQVVARSGGSELKALRNLRAIVLVSDGVVTEGAHPAFDAPQLGIPVYTVAVGDSLPARDLLVRRVDVNALVYRGSQVPVTVWVRGVGIGEQRVEVVLKSGREELARETLTLTGERTDERVSLGFVADSAGTRRLTASVSPVAGERTTRNNVYPFSVRVLESRIRLLLLGGGPSADVACVRRAFERDPNIELTTRIQKQEGVFYEGEWSPAVARDADAVVLVGFPVPATSQEVLRSLAGALEGKPSVLFVMSRLVDHAKLRQLERKLSFAVESVGTLETRLFVRIPDEHRSHPLFQLSGGRSLADLVQALPPLFALQGAYRPAPDARVVAVGGSGAGGTKPFLIARSEGRQRSLAVLGYGLWQWDLLRNLPDGSERLAEHLLSNAVRWLTAVTDERRVRVNPVREVVEGGEPVEFTGEVYDESLLPVSNAEVKVTVEGAGGNVVLSLIPSGNGRYEGSLPELPEGSYRYEATATRRGEGLGRDRGDVVVEEGTLEFRETAANPALLRQLAARSGGVHVGAEHPEGLARAVRNRSDFLPREEVRADDLRPMNLEWFTAVVVGLFAAEWILRRRAGML
jgi:hypothetical protein